MHPQHAAVDIMREHLVAVLRHAAETGASVFEDPDAVLKAVGERLEAERLLLRGDGQNDIASYLSFHGVETITERFDAAGRGVGGDEDREALSSDEDNQLTYLNAGEAYAPTVCYDHSDRLFFLGDWGSWVEQRDLGAMAADISIRDAENSVRSALSPKP